MITEEMKNQNFVVFEKQLERYGIQVGSLFEKYGAEIKNSAMNTSIDSGLAYDGAMVQFVLKVLTPYALKINDLLPESLRVDKTSLIKVCLFNQLAKSLMFVVNDNTWEIEKRGMVYKFKPTKYALKTGMRSLLMCNECGISFNEEEAEAMTIIDRDSNDDQAKFYASPMSVILRQANELALMEIKLSNK